MATRKSSVIQVMITGDAKDLQRASGVAVTAVTGILTAVSAAASAITAGLGASVAAAASFEQAFAGVAKTVKASDAELAALNDGIRELATEIPATHTEIAAVAAAAGQLGIQTDAILGFTEVMIGLGVATNMSAETAAVQLSRLANITGMSQTDFDRLGSTIVALGNTMATTEAEISEMALNLATTGSLVGLTESQILALSAAASELGINAEAGGTALNRTFDEMAAAVSSGGAELELFAAAAGMSASEFATAFEEDAGRAFEAFISGLAEINESGGDVLGVLRDLGVTEQRQRRTLLALVQGHEGLTEALNTADKAWEDNTALGEETSRFYETFISQLTILKNNLVDVGISFGDVLLPYLGQLTGWFQENREEIRATVDGWVQRFETFVASAATKFEEFKQYFNENLKQPLLDFIDTLSTWATDVGSALGNVITEFQTFFDDLRNDFENADATALGTALGNLISEALRIGFEAIENVTQPILDFIDRVDWPSVGLKFGEILVQVLVGAALGVVAGDWLMPILKFAFENAIDLVLLFLASKIPIIGPYIAKVIKRIPFIRTLDDFFQRGLTGLWNALKPRLGFIFGEGISGVVQGFLQRFPVLAGTTIKGWGTRFGIALARFGDDIALRLGGVFERVGRAIGNMTGGAIRGLGTWMARVVSAVRGYIGRFFSAGIDLIRGLINGATSLGKRLRDKVAELAREALRALKDALGISSPSKVFYDAGQMMMLGLIGGIEDSSSRAVREVERMASRIGGIEFRLSDVQVGDVPTVGAGVRGGTLVERGAIEVNLTVNGGEPEKVRMAVDQATNDALDRLARELGVL